MICYTPNKCTYCLWRRGTTAFCWISKKLKWFEVTKRCRLVGHYSLFFRKNKSSFSCTWKEDPDHSPDCLSRLSCLLVSIVWSDFFFSPVTFFPKYLHTVSGHFLLWWQQSQVLFFFFKTEISGNCSRCCWGSAAHCYQLWQQQVRRRLATKRK